MIKNKIAILLLAFISSCSLTAQTNTDKTFPLVISFTSHCCGVPDNKPIIDYVKCFRKKYKTQTISAYRIGPAGKEGEYYLAFPLNELDKNKAEKFIKGIECITITPGDKGAVIYEKNFTIDSLRFSKPLLNEENVIRI